VKRALAILSLLFPTVCSAIIVTGFQDIDTYLRRGVHIVIAECVSIPTNGPMWDGLYFVEVNLLRTLKGDWEPGRLTIATIWPMISGKTYLLYSMGGSAGKAKFIAIPELSVVEVSHRFSLPPLVEMPLREEILSLFRDRLGRVKEELADKTSVTLSLHDADRQAIWVRLKNPLASDRIAQYLLTRLSAKTRELLAIYGPPYRSNNDEVKLWHAFLNDLNQIIRSGPIYDSHRFAGVRLSSQTAGLLKQNPQGVELMHLNVGLLLDAFPVGHWRDPWLDREKPLLEKALGEQTALSVAPLRN
jgi:hypothetical protein